MRPDPRPENAISAPTSAQMFEEESAPVHPDPAVPADLVPADPVQTDRVQADLSGDSLLQPEVEAVFDDQVPPELYCAYEPAFAHQLPRLIPNLGHVAVYFLLAVVLLVVGQVLGVFLMEQLHFFGHRSFNDLFHLSAEDARLSIPVQAISYGLIALVMVPVFTLIWNEPFSEGVQWNGALARRRWMGLAALGLASGFGISLLGNLLPMPKDPPIMQDMMKSPLGAWLMLIFGVTAAPLLEELTFRGFLLPGMVNCFRWLAREGRISEGAIQWAGIPISIFITSLAFAFLHSPQVSHAWGPLVLIGMVSVVLCIVRLRTKSVMAGVVVHAAYNFTLFAAVLAETGGFRHLDKLTN